LANRSELIQEKFGK